MVRKSTGWESIPIIIGRASVGVIENRLRQERVKYLVVTTLHPDDPYEPYRRTLAFYERLGFELLLSRDPLAYYLKPL